MSLNGYRSLANGDHTEKLLSACLLKFRRSIKRRHFSIPIKCSTIGGKMGKHYLVKYFHLALQWISNHFWLFSHLSELFFSS